MNETLNVQFNQVFFKHYLAELYQHIFGDTPVKELMSQLDNHRAKHVITLYLMQDRDTFYYYYCRQSKLNLTEVFNLILTALNGGIQSTLTSNIAIMLDVADLSYDEVFDEHALKEFRKNLISFVVWANKRDPNEFMFLKESINKVKFPPIEQMEPYKTIRKLVEGLEKLGNRMR